MAIYSDEAIQEILNDSDVVDIVGDYVSLKRSGRNFMGLCPFHKEKTPSFVVSPDKQIYKCFGCGEGGNVIHFVMKQENLDFREALEYLADRNNIDLSRYIVKSSYNNEADKSLKDRLYKLDEDAVEYFYSSLLKSDAKLAQEYVKKRKINMQMLKAFKLGYGGPRSYDTSRTLIGYLKGKGYTEKEILMSGLVTKRDNGSLYERFAGRLIFPICDTRDRIIAFGGRVLDDSLPKYVNSPDTIIYSKGKHLYGMNIAKREKMDYIIIVEGYMDALSLHKYDIHNSVASLGTALTEAQGRLIRKYTQNVLICYDSDAAGQAATIRGMDILTSLGLNVKILRLDGAKDPDEYINKFGTERFRVCIKNAIPLVEYKISLLADSVETDTTDGKIKFLNEMAKILSKVENNIERNVYIDNIAKKYNMANGPIISVINKLMSANNKKEDTDFDVNNNIKEILKNKKTNINKQEHQDNVRYETIIAMLLQKDNEIFKIIDRNSEYIQIEDEILSSIYEYLLELYRSGSINEIDVLSTITNNEWLKKLTDIMQIDIDDSKKYDVLSNIVSILKLEKLTADVKRLTNQLIDKTKYSKEEIDKIYEELNEKTILINSLK